MLLLASPLLALAQDSTENNSSSGPALDCTISHYNRILTAEGVLRESHYSETMLRRPGHVWVSRVLPANIPQVEEAEDHKHFNHSTLPHHITLQGKQPAIEFIDPHEKYRINVEAAEYANVDFDGSWKNAFYLISPEQIARIPKSMRVSATPGTQWHEVENNGLFTRILWDEKNQIPLLIENGDKKQTFYKRIEIKLHKTLQRTLPWQQLQNYARREYADFLD